MLPLMSLLFILSSILPDQLLIVVLGASTLPTNSSHPGSSIGTTYCMQDDGLGELEVLDLLARRRVKGRGAIGSRADEPGPFLPPGADGERKSCCTSA